jgi:hypothetical protein
MIKSLSASLFFLGPATVCRRVSWVDSQGSYKHSQIKSHPGRLGFFSSPFHSWRHSIWMRALSNCFGNNFYMRPYYAKYAKRQRRFSCASQMSSMSVPRLQSSVISMGEWVGTCTANYELINHPSQFYDLVEIFRIGGYAPYTNYLFLGECTPSLRP